MIFKNMWEAIYSLQDPHLVARIQKYYGVKVRKQGSKPSQNTTLFSKNKLNNSFGCDSNGDLSGNVISLAEANSSRITTQKITTNGVKASHCFNSSPRIYSRPTKDEQGYDQVSSESTSDSKIYVITNHWWYYLFLMGTALGDEIFYASFIPFWFWNIDGAVGRRVVLVWATIMYIGQGIKDIVRWPRPACPPVVRLQKKWALEYGMPSTHAMVGVSIPFSVILYTMNRYQYSVQLGLVIAVAWCTVICISRLYLGMHTVLDIVVGLGLALILMIPVVPLVDMLDHYILTNHWSPVVMVAVALLLIVFYPASDRWTPTRTDTTMVVSVCVGVHLGAWTNYQLGNLTMSDEEPPYHIIWPSYSMVGLTVFRTALGFCCMLATKALCKSASYGTACTLLRLDPRELKESRHSMENKVKATVEITYTFITYLLLGFNTAYLLPNTFRLLGIERPTFYTEI